ncbi:hypothetical protein KW792_02070 [Candidatus Saccharibacteria bacterium]|nr:hypothetical protein [Candidatus Saccharibacteria bacterium]
MLILLHIVMALGGLITAGLNVLKPSLYLKNTAYVLVTGTFITGFGLIITQSAPLKQTCISGLVYLSVASLLLVAGRYRTS